MLTFIVFVFSILLLALQLASAQLTPRVIAHFYRNQTLRWSLSLFVFVFTFDLAVLARIDESVPALSGYVAAYSTVGAIGIFIYMIEKVGKSLRPISVLTSIGTLGHDVVATVYPRSVSAGRAPGPGSTVPAGTGERAVASLGHAVVQAFDPVGLAGLARRADCLIELVPQVGDFVANGDPLFRLGGLGSATVTCHP